MTESTATETSTTTETPAAPESMADKLAAAGEKAKAAKAARTMKVVKGASLNPTFLEAVTAAGLKSEEKSGFYKVTSDAKGKALYLARKGGRVDLSGFTVTNDAVTQISEETAREKHLGKVRGQLNFELAGTPEGEAQLTAAFKAALVELAVPLPVVEKPAKAPKAPKAETAPAADAPAAEEVPAPRETPPELA